jgi:hypothetical protein
MMKSVLFGAAALAFAALGLNSALAADAVVPPQQHPPAACKQGDSDCILESASEYGAAIFAEWKEWQAFEPQALAAVQRRDGLAASRLLETAMSQNLYKHNHWAMPKLDDIIAANIDPDDWDAVIACRTAVIDLKFILIAVVSSPENIANSRADYLQSAKQCREAFP